MYDPVTLDQLRAFVTVVEEGSFSAAARKLQRVQSAISTSMSNLESQLGVPIWDRTTKVAKLTEQGQALLGAARRVLGEVDALRRLTAGMVMGLEASVSLCVDALFPLSAADRSMHRVREGVPGGRPARRHAGHVGGLDPRARRARRRSAS